MLPAHCHRRIRVAEQADLSTVRGVAAELSAAAALDEGAAGRVQIVVCELATNLLRHADGGGAILLRRLDAPGGVECIALDQGPGIVDLAAALADRADPAPRRGPGLGCGLGAVRRLSGRFDIHSEPGAGTAVLARVLKHGPLKHGPAGPEPAFECGAVMLPMSGGNHCGDGWLVRPDGLVVAIDGLGHGEAASIAARRAEAIAGEAAPDDDPQTVLAAMHDGLRGTRGVVAAVLRLTDRRIEYSSVGNIAMTVIRRSGAATLTGRWGVVGYNAAPPSPAGETWGPGEHLILHSDGCTRLADRFLERHLRHVDPVLAAAVLLRDGGARVDDQTVIVLRNSRRAPRATESG